MTVTVRSHPMPRGRPLWDRLFGPSHMWEVVEPFHFRGFTVPAGFMSDLDSIPRLPLIFWLLKGRTVAGAILHDWLYSQQTDRRQADEILYHLMWAEGVGLLPRELIYLGVRCFGWIPYRRHQE